MNKHHVSKTGNAKPILDQVHTQCEHAFFSIDFFNGCFGWFEENVNDIKYNGFFFNFVGWGET
jgi:hypothetical protein